MEAIEGRKRKMHMDTGTSKTALRPMSEAEAAAMPPRVSLVIPCYNEEESVDELMTEVFQVIERHNRTRRGGHLRRRRLARQDVGEAAVVGRRETPRLKLVRFRRNFGQTAAMVAGMDHSSGDVIIPLDADLQNDPNSIPVADGEDRRGLRRRLGLARNRQDTFISASSRRGSPTRSSRRSAACTCTTTAAR
jgi:glycosyltransferase involved in cell wall biosynthesis